MGLSTYEIEKGNFRVSQGKQESRCDRNIHSTNDYQSITVRSVKNKESFESKVLKQSNIVLQLPLPSWFRKLNYLALTWEDDFRLSANNFPDRVANDATIPSLVPLFFCICNH